MLKRSRQSINNCRCLTENETGASLHFKNSTVGLKLAYYGHVLRGSSASMLCCCWKGNLKERKQEDRLYIEGQGLMTCRNQRRRLRGGSVGQDSPSLCQEWSWDRCKSREKHFCYPVQYQVVKVGIKKWRSSVTRDDLQFLRLKFW